MKGQEVLDYLMTYGWAILIVIIVIGAGWSLGLFNPENWNGKNTCISICQNEGMLFDSLYGFEKRCVCEYKGEAVCNVVNEIEYCEYNRTEIFRSFVYGN